MNAQAWRNRVAIGLFEIDLAGFQIIMHQPSFAAVDRIHHAGAPGIDDAGAPGARVLLAIDQAGSADKGRLHALHDGVAGQLRANRLADHGARAVAADEIPTAQTPDSAGVEIAQGDRKSTRLNSSHSQISYAVFC